MNSLERAIWAAAFVDFFMHDYHLSYGASGSRRTIDDISGFSAAEVADVVLNKAREALAGHGKEYLAPVKEVWPGYEPASLAHPASPLSHRCSRCGRLTWATGEGECGMTQPDGLPCRGQVVPNQE